MEKESIQHNYSNGQTFALTFLRILIGWHFLYEGLVKLFNPAWSAKEYLLGSVGPLSTVFKNLATSSVLGLVNLLNIWGLILIGLSLFVGLFARITTILGIILLFFYYFAYPPFSGLSINMPAEGSYWIVNKNLIEIAALLVLFMFPCSNITGIDKFLIFKKAK